jgi:very-short-patch-repair endonuclease
MPSTIRARELRRDMSGTERRVWYRLRRDQRKTAFLESAGFRVLRIPASMTDEHLDDVIATVFRELDHPIPAAAPPTYPASGEVKFSS